MPLDTGYLHHPTIAGDLVAFATEDDLWTVAAGGGVAQRRTATLSDVVRASLSPDGKLLAFTGRDEHHPEVYCMPSEGGPARRLTWLGHTALVRGWTPDGRILFITDNGQPFLSIYEAFAVAPTGGDIDPLRFGPVLDVAYETDGPGVVLGRQTVDPARWKRYRGGRAGDLWIDRRGDGTFRRLIELAGNLGSPMFLGGRVWFLSDHEGIGNLYSCRPDGRELRRHTDHDTYYARFATSDGARIVYQHAAELWLYDPAADSTAKIPVDLPSPRTRRQRKFVPADRFLNGYAVHPAGHSLSVETRGRLFTMPLWEHAVRQYGPTDADTAPVDGPARTAARHKLARWVGDGSALVAISDEDGEDAIDVHSPSPSDGDGIPTTRRLRGLDLGCVTDLATPPKGGLVAVSNHRNELLLVDLDAGTVRQLDRSEHGGLGGLAWSSDGSWLAYSFATGAHTRTIKVCDPESGTAHAVSGSEFRDVAPAWDPDGRYLYFLSYRTFNPVYDSLYFDLGFPKAMRPYLLTLRADEPSPFVPAPRGLGPAPDQTKPEEPTKGATKGAKAAKDAAKNAAEQEPERVRIDFEGIERRVAGFPIEEGRYTQVIGIKNKVLFTSFPVSGSLGESWQDAEPKPNGSLEVYDLVEQKHDVLAKGVTFMEVSRDGATLVYRSGRRLRAIKAGEKPPDGMDNEPPGRKSGWIDLGRVRVSVDPGAEWRQMLGEAWRLQRDHFWVPDMSGVDWPAMYDRYLPLVDKVASRFEFSDLMWEMQGELGTSHAYELGGDYRPPPPYAMGHLGADVAWDARVGRWRIAHIVEGDPWDPASGSPMVGPGVRVAEGDTLLAIGGRRLDADVTPASLLVNQAGLLVELTVGDAKGENPRTVVVKTLRDDRPARYREWVARNRSRVHDATGGRVGYVHVPDMGPPGYAEFHRSYLSEVERDALIVDVRFNGGGNVSQLVLEKLAGRRIGYDVPRWAPPEPYPSHSPGGPLVAITNESAGSDGDIFTHCFKLLGLGPVVGKRTWGGVIGISPSHALVDGTMTTQPEYSFWFVDVGWDIENHGAEPDYNVDIRPQDHAAGLDPQLDKAVELAERALRRWRPPRPDLSRRPDLTLPTLPPRAAPRSAPRAVAKRAAPRSAPRAVAKRAVARRAVAKRAAATRRRRGSR